LAGAIERARACSPFLSMQLDRLETVAAALAEGRLDTALEAARAQGAGEDVMAALRRERSGYALALGIGDLAGTLTLTEVVEALSDLADRAMERALAAAIAERTPDEAPRGFAIIAMGKLGGRELNYSSDIDLIFLYDPATLPRKPREEPRRRIAPEAHGRRLRLPRRSAAAPVARGDADRAAGRGGDQLL